MKSCGFLKSVTKIAVVLPHLKPGGIELATVRLVNELHGKRFQFVMILGERAGSLIRQLSPDISVIVLKNRRAFRSIPELRQILQSNGIEVVYSGTNARNIATLLATRGLPDEQRPKTIISEHTSPADYLAEAKLSGFRKILMRRLYPKADLLVAPTDGLAADWLRHLGIGKPEPVTLPNPILDQHQLNLAQRPAAEVDGARDRAHILCIGRMHPAKGQDVLIRAFAQAIAIRPDLRLSFLGEGPFQKDLEHILEEKGLSESIRFCGYVPDVAAELASAGLLVVPSRREGFGNVVVEALVQGTPVLATDCPGPRASLEDAGAGGRIVGVEDVEAMATAIVEMTGDPGAPLAAREAGKALAERYEVGHASRVFAERVEEMLEQQDD